MQQVFCGPHRKCVPLFEHFIPSTCIWNVRDRAAGRDCQRNSAADEKLFITSHGGEGVYNFRRGLDLGVNFENPQNVIGVEILRHGTGIPCKCCQTTFCLKAKTKISPVQNYCAHCTGLQVSNPRGYPLCILLVAAPEFRQR